jgi:hypothetical protein
MRTFIDILWCCGNQSKKKRYVGYLLDGIAAAVESKLVTRLGASSLGPSQSDSCYSTLRLKNGIAE